MLDVDVAIAVAAKVDVVGIAVGQEIICDLVEHSRVCLGRSIVARVYIGPHLQ